ncbi:hypothetical protein ALT_4284 [Aspergillus lentulus]|uniref:Hepatocellular carcinoma-associated antigen 59-domain-containing protein n=1 Tax=Aspergillus lentulus TaxID=293939 RepID=A0AAN4PIW6_ASPLE|nr:hypothetical protein CNMCM6069_003207 [Aspergillus lentulus]KAF4160824.1 hypothetical protein CNMCM6936_003754 [Aspergillus lentulus]KAF4171251.1 hypothetical protein CNMCM8060_003459 [Aspergillus lentulus]KAF4177545.1 hypothetical protein CNMCM7927_003045 [Aspergillus lentulus]KAF4190709.1 hypothetical protein CNMCM8694_003090 [Aspergillus lentulus]
MDTDVIPNTEAMFRPVKRRKFLRRRQFEPEDSQEEAHVANANSIHDNDSSASQPPSQSNDTVSSTDLARLRRLQRARKGGIEFSNTSRQGTDKTGNQAAVTTVTAEDLENEKIRAMCDRFTAYTGQTVDVDKHIQQMPANTTDLSISTTSQASSDGLSTTVALQREPASLGKLHEIDLGQEAKLQNIARTEAATRRLVGDDRDASPAHEDSTSNIAASGKDGRPWRNRRRRNNEDIERDRLVEEVLRESKLDVYDEPEEEALLDDQAADDRVAEQFRREFLDAIQSRRRVTRTKNTKTAAKPEVPRGPKLGGSRSARAAMRERQEKSAGRK